MTRVCNIFPLIFDVETFYLLHEGENWSLKILLQKDNRKDIWLKCYCPVSETVAITQMKAPKYLKTQTQTTGCDIKKSCCAHDRSLEKMRQPF